MGCSHGYIEYSIITSIANCLGVALVKCLRRVYKLVLVILVLQKDWLRPIWKAHIGCFGVLMAISKNKLGRRRFQSSSMLLPSMRVEVELDSMSAFLVRAVTAVNPLPAYSEVACLKTFRTFTIQSINVESMVRIEFKMNQLQHATYTSIDPYLK